MDNNISNQLNVAASAYDFALSDTTRTELRKNITQAYRMPEQEAIASLLPQARLNETIEAEVQKTALDLAQKLRHKSADKGRSRLVQNLLQEFSLSSEEGISLMCLAEALLRIPDKKTRDLLIQDKIAQREWLTHAGKSKSIFVNAATWGLVITGKLVAPRDEAGLSNSLFKLLGKSGAPIIRKAVDYAMRLMGEQFVMGETIESALSKATAYEKKGYRYSYDMLGEAALTDKDAQLYFDAYEKSIHAIGKNSDSSKDLYNKAGISIKLSALHSRYERAHKETVMTELYERLKKLTLLARSYNIGINIDAEETNRLELSLDLLEKLCFEPELEGWHGIGFVIQAYQKRCPFVIDYIVDLAKRSNHKLMIRLVKGAYWDSEIKLAQVDGQVDYPVYTRKAHTDISYLACAKRLLNAPEWIYPQFATHNAYTVSAVYHMAGPDSSYEFQCLHGMGESLYTHVVKPVSEGGLGRPCRIYAPVGTHETLLAYLVRRLLENGANSSFVNRISDHSIALKDLVEDPIALIENQAKQDKMEVGTPHPSIVVPRNLYGEQRLNSEGLDFSNENLLECLSTELQANADKKIAAASLTACEVSCAEPVNVINPAVPSDVIGTYSAINVDSIPAVIEASDKAFQSFSKLTPSERADILNKTADLLENNKVRLMDILIREAGKTYNNAIAEIREAVDFLRYYSSEISHNFSNEQHKPLGVIVCISPWNFPLAIFTGQIAAALATGNTVVAKPSEQTPLVAHEAVKLFYEAGLPTDALQLVLGSGSVLGNALLTNDKVAGVCFTGSTAVSKILHHQLADRCQGSQEIPLIAETGGINAMIVDSSALTEQVVTDVVASAFDSAGQRCSALRVLCLQEDVADKTIAMLKGAMDALQLGDTRALSSDIGPVIDKKSQKNILDHINDLAKKGLCVYQAPNSVSFVANQPNEANFVAPTLIELESFSQLDKEIFGPVLHVVRFKQEDLPKIIEAINKSQYGLTLGLQTRIDSTIEMVLDTAEVGNIYVNRNMVGAVVGVQPFGGEKLSGTGPKAGGPLYLYRFLSSYPELTVDHIATSQPVTLHSKNQDNFNAQQRAFVNWLEETKRTNILSAWNHYFSSSLLNYVYELLGPTGETNNYYLSPRKKILGIANNANDILIQLAAVLSLGSKMVWETKEEILEIYNQLPSCVKEQIQLTDDWSQDFIEFDGVIYHGAKEALPLLCKKIANKKGAIISMQRLEEGETNIRFDRLFLEHSESINTAAAGGNVSLMTIEF